MSEINRVAPDIISGPGPGRNPAKFSYPARPDMAAGYEVGFDHLLMHLPHFVIWQEFIVLQIRQFAPLYFIMGMWIIPTSSFPFVFHCWLHSYVYVMLPRPPAQEHSAPTPTPAGSVIPNPAPSGFEKIKSGATLEIKNSRLGPYGKV